MPLPYTGKHGELNFEADLIEMLQSVGWNDGLLKNVDEKDLIENWRNILNTNNKAKLNGVELSDNEMMQIMAPVILRYSHPVKANINVRDNKTTNIFFITCSPSVSWVFCFCCYMYHIGGRLKKD